MVENDEAERKIHDLKEEVNIDTKVDALYSRFMKKMTEFESVGYGHLGHLSVTEQRIEIASNKT